MGRHHCDIYKVARQCGVILRASCDHSPTSRKPRECFCKPTLREIGREHGEDHLRLVLQLMVGTVPNSRELFADMIKAVSSVIVRNPELIKRRTLLDDFDAIDLGSLRRKAKAMNCGMPTTHVLRVLISVRFYQPIQGDLLDWIGEAA
ncbi:hypothetical protein F9L06_10175 [Brucella anthropi]|uniref:Uncharacterized protein n=1 Tax=Brucella anthropi TaxID=529 RepID=A0A6I0DTE4_BRUAN|nr:hypothetical protein [Brucella anthropi]KAB2798961.1 hypothetical protein F9L06_10175 [Brucella anthropi]